MRPASTTSTPSRVLRDSTAVLLMGSRERHYTPSKVFPALVAGRPGARGRCTKRATPRICCARIGGAPQVRLVTYGDATAQARVDAIAGELSALD